MKTSIVLSIVGTLSLNAADFPKTGIKSGEKVWTEPPVVGAQYDGTPVAAPKGAVILFDGKAATAWLQLPPKEKPDQAAEPVLWKIENDYLEIVPRSGMIRTREKIITSGHLHIEWATPAVVKGEGQGRGNSGVMIEGFPELQVLDSFNNKTYFDGQAAAFYKNRPPLVNACRAPGLWQCYDIHIRRAKMVNGEVNEPASITVYHNNVLVQDHVTFPSPLQAGDLRLQDHLNPGRFRNIWFVSVTGH